MLFFLLIDTIYCQQKINKFKKSWISSNEYSNTENDILFIEQQQSAYMKQDPLLMTNTS